MSRTKNASRNIFWGTLNKLISIGIPFATRTVMIYTMGMKYVGLGSLFSSILQVLSFAELGIGGALVFSMYKPIAEGNDKEVCALLNFYRKTYRVIGLVILIFGLLIMPFLRHLIAGETPDDINIYILFSIYLLNSILGYFLFAYKQSLFTASQRVDMISKITMILHLISGIAQIIILLSIHNYYAFAFVIPIITCLSNICVGKLTDKYYPQYRCEGNINKDELKSIQKKVGGMVFQKLGGIILTSVDTIVISTFLGLTALAMYQNYYYIITSLFAFLSVIMQSIVSAVGNSIATETVEKNYNDFKKFNFIYMWIVSWSTTCLLCLYQPFMKVWVGEKNMLGIGMVFLFAMFFFGHKWCDMLFVYQEACGIWWETKFVPLSAAIVNLILNIILVQVIGLPGILISTIVAVVFIYDIGYAKVLFKTYFKTIERGILKYWGRQLFYLGISIVASTITLFICNRFIFSSTIIKLITNFIICVFVPNVIFIISWHRLKEFHKTKEMLMKIVDKRTKYD